MWGGEGATGQVQGGTKTVKSNNGGRVLLCVGNIVLVSHVVGQFWQGVLPREGTSRAIQTRRFVCRVCPFYRGHDENQAWKSTTLAMKTRSKGFVHDGAGGDDRYGVTNGKFPQC